MAEVYANNYSSTLSAGYTAGAGSISVTSASGLPSLLSSDTLHLTIVDQTTNLVKLIIKVTAISGTTLTITAESSDTNCSSGDKIYGTMLTVDALAQRRKDMQGYGAIASRPASASQTLVTGQRYSSNDEYPNQEYQWSGSAWLKPRNLPPFQQNITRNVYTTSRATALDSGSHVVYQNTTGYPLLVMANLSSSGNAGKITAYCDSSSNPTTEVCGHQLTGTWAGLVIFVVPNNYYYSCTVSSTGWVVNQWFEYQLTGGTWTQGSDLSGSKSLSTVYHNTTGNTVVLLVTANTSGGGDTLVVTSDSGSSPSAISSASTPGNSAGRVNVMAIIPNGHYYKVTSSASPSLIRWYEHQWTLAALKSSNYFTTEPQLRHLMFTGGNAFDRFSIFYVNNSGKDRIIIPVFNVNGWSAAGFASSNGINRDYGLFQTAQGYHCTPIVTNDGDYYWAATDDTSLPTLTCWFEYDLG